MTSRLGQQIGRRIVQQRVNLAWSQADLRAETGIPVETISRLENGHRLPSASVLVLLCRTFEVTAAELLGT